jgi:plasmid maintenance system antidote protein VapI
LTDDEWLQLQKKFSALEKFIRKIAEELGITKLEATIIIRDRKDLLKRAADEIGTDDEAHVLGILTRQIELFENEPFEKDQQQEQRVPTAVKREYSEKILRPGETVEEEEEVTTEREKTK